MMFNWQVHVNGDLMFKEVRYKPIKGDYLNMYGAVYLITAVEISFAYPEQLIIRTEKV